MIAAPPPLPSPIGVSSPPLPPPMPKGPTIVRLMESDEEELGHSS